MVLDPFQSDDDEDLDEDMDIEDVLFQFSGHSKPNSCILQDGHEWF